MAGFRSPLSHGRDRSYCIPMGSARQACGPYSYAEFLVRERLASGENPEMWIHDLGPLEQQLVREVQERIRMVSIQSAIDSAARLQASVVQVANRE